MSRLLAALVVLAACNKDKPVEPAPGPAAAGDDAAAAANPEPVAAAPDDARADRSGAPPFEEPAITVDGNQVTIELTRRPGVPLPGGRVPYTAEPYNLIGTVAGDTVSEADILGTGLALDLDGDGDTDDAVAVACAGGATAVPLGDATGQVRTYTPDRIARVSDDGAWLVSYTPCQDGFVQVGLAPAGQPIEIARTAGPALQILVFAPAEGPVIPEPLELRVSADGVPLATTVHTGAAYEPIFAEQPAWAAMHWVMVPLRDSDRQSFSFTLPEADAPRMVTASVNLGPEPDQRWRLKPAVAPVP